MGQLIAKHYPTKLAANAADHTYVECGTGARAWACWGGKTGGAVLRAGIGSTARADAIAEPDEKAGIACYLINGVCHQSANRILLPAGILVTGARGYNVSSALFGPYGRLRGALGLCRAPFNQHTGISGDLPECVGSMASLPDGESRPGSTRSRSRRSLRPAAPRVRAYQRDVLRLYSRAQHIAAADATDRDIEDFSVELFRRLIELHLGARVARRTQTQLADTRRSTERSRLHLEAYYVNREIDPATFVGEFNRETIVFQNSIAGVLNRRQYRQLFDLDPGETVVLADPDIVKVAFL
jgi:hypothetical protein